MEYEIRADNDEKYIEVVTRGVADTDASLGMAKTIKEIMQQHRMTKVLIDHRNIEKVSGKTIEIYDRPKILRLMGIIMNIKIAEVIKPDHVKHFSFFETVCINQGFKVSIFHEILPALEWLLK
jgi:CxxC motif-containing protein